MKDPQRGADASQEQPGQSQQGGDGKQPTEAETLRAEVEQLRSQNEELSRSERYWAEQAKAEKTPAKGGKKKAAVEDLDLDDFEDEDEEAEDGDDTPEKLVDDLSAKGINALINRGFITKKDGKALIIKIASKVANQIVDKKTKQLNADAELFTSFPALKNTKSELYQETSKVFKAMIARDPNLQKSPAALYEAAEKAQMRLELAAAKAGKRPTDDDDDIDDAEQDRLERVMRQAGERGSRRRSSVEDREDDSVTPQQKRIMAEFALTEDEFKAGRRGRS